MYEFAKICHLLAIISWMAGLLYLPRLMVYHADAERNGELSETLKVMERRLLKAIMTPAMVAAWVFGVWLAFLQNLWSDWQVWWIIKFVSVVALSVCHMWLAKQVKSFAQDANALSSRQWRVINEIPTVIMIIVIVAVVMRPFS